MFNHFYRNIILIVIFCMMGMHPAAAAEQLLADFGTIQKPDVLPSDPEEKIFKTVFPSYVQSLQECKVTSAGTTVVSPFILSWAKGSFTAAGSPEVAYIIGYQTCAQQTVSQSQLMIIAGGKVVIGFPLKGADEIHVVGDIDKDGTDEFLLLDTFKPKDTLITYAALFSAKGKQRRMIEDFKEVRSNPCDFLDQGTFSFAAIYYDTQPTLHFTRKTTEKKCSAVRP